MRSVPSGSSSSHPSRRASSTPPGRTPRLLRQVPACLVQEVSDNSLVPVSLHLWYVHQCTAGQEWKQGVVSFPIGLVRRVLHAALPDAWRSDFGWLLCTCCFEGQIRVDIRELL